MRFARYGLAVVALLAACSRGETGTSPAESALLDRLDRAEADFVAGRLGEARRQFDEIAAETPPSPLLTRAKLGLARVDAIEHRFAVALDSLRIIAGELGRAWSAEAETEFERVQEAMRDHPRHAALVAEAASLREIAHTQLAARRAAESRDVGDRIDQGEFAAALLAVRELESLREPTDVADLESLLEKIDAASVSHANDFIASLATEDARVAIERLDARLAASAGTSGAAVLLAERARRGNGARAPRSPPSANEKDG